MRAEREGVGTALQIGVLFVLGFCLYEVLGAWLIQFTGAAPPIDFAHFYALGHAAGDIDSRGALVDAQRWRQLVDDIAPGAGLMFPRVYGPQLALFLAPWAWMPMAVSYVIWGIVSWLTIALCAIWLIRHSVPALLRHRERIGFALLAFPAVVHLLIVGQAGAIAVAGSTLTIAGLTRGRPVPAGLGVAALSFKPTLFLPVLAAAFLGGQWRLCLVACGGALAGLLGTIPLLGPEPLRAYLTTLIAFGQRPDYLAKPSIMASLRTLAYQIIPEPGAGWFYVATAIVVILAAGWAWRCTASSSEQVSLALLATVLAAPHVYNYDLVILMPAFVISAGWAMEQRPGWRLASSTAVIAYVAPWIAIEVSSLPVSVTALANLGWFVAVFRTVVVGRDRVKMRGADEDVGAASMNGDGATAARLA